MGIIDSILGRPATQAAKPIPAAPVQEQENQIQQQQAETNPLDAYKGCRILGTLRMNPPLLFLSTMKLFLALLEN